MEFITLISSEANDISERESKKTIGVEHVVAALKDLGFPDYVTPVEEAAEEFKATQQNRERRQRIDTQGMSEEERARLQADLFRQASEKYASESTQQP